MALAPGQYQQVEISKISNQIPQWATESTLQRVAESSETATEIMSRIARARDINLDGIKKFEQRVGAAGEAAQQSAEQARKGNTGFRNAVDDLKKELGGLERSLSYQAGRMLKQDPLQMLPGLVEKASTGIASKADSWGNSLLASKNNLAKFGGGLLKLTGVILPFVGATLGIVTERYVEHAEKYRDMINAGVIFSGTVESMSKAVRANGVSLEKATQIIGQYGTTIVAAGQKSFFNAVGKMNQTFANFGMTADQGTEHMAEMMDQQRLTSTMYTQSTQDQIDMNTRLLGLMQSQAILTGISIKRQKEDQRRVAESKRLQLLMAGASPEEKVKLEEAKAQVSGIGLSAESQTALMLAFASQGQIITDDLKSLMPMMGDQVQDMISAFMGGTLKQAMPGIMDTAANVYEDRARQFRGQAGAKDERYLAPLGFFATAQARRGRGPTTPQEQAEDAETKRLAALAEQGQMLSGGVLQTYQTANRIQAGIGAVEAKVIDLAGPVVKEMLAAGNAMADSLSNLSKKDGALALFAGALAAATAQMSKPAGAPGATAATTGPGIAETALAAAAGGSLGSSPGGTPSAPKTGIWNKILSGGGTAGKWLGRGVAGLGGMITAGQEYMESGDWVKALVVGTGSTLGGIAGGLIGGAAGTALGGPGVGNVIGGIGGAYYGSGKGEQLSRELYDWLTGPKSPTPLPITPTNPTTSPVTKPLQPVDQMFYGTDKEQMERYEQERRQQRQRQSELLGPDGPLLKQVVALREAIEYQTSRISKDIREA